MSGPTVRGYYEILVDTLLGRWLPSYRRRPKRRVSASPKFYFADVGVVNLLARRGSLQAGSEQFGRAFENWILHELAAHDAYTESHRGLSYWRTTSGFEVDFIVGDLELAVEAKATSKVVSHHLKGLRALAEDHPEVRKRIIVTLEPRARKTQDGILILPAKTFARDLWSNRLFDD